jgi:hypothetical protein
MRTCVSDVVVWSSVGRQVASSMCNTWQGVDCATDWVVNWWYGLIGF